MNRLRSVVAFALLAGSAVGWSAPSDVWSQQGTTPSSEACGSDVTPEEAQRYLELLGRGLPQAPTTLDPPYCVPIAGHIVRSSAGTGGLSLSRYQQAIQDANDAFANTGIVFYSLGIDYIDDDTYYIDVQGSELTTLRQVNVVPAAINVYFAPNPVGLCGISSFTFSSTQGIIQNNSCTGLPSNPSTFPHEIGHYFDLFHTHETAFGAELVNGSNCGFAGDQLCDTPADPRLSSGTVNGACQYTGGQTDINGDPYAPDANQYMSYSPATCRNAFSPQSEAKAVQILLTLRPDLLSRGCSPQGNASVSQVDPPDGFVDQTLDAILVGANLGVFTGVFLGDGITVNYTDSISNDSLLVNLTIDVDATIGPRDVIVNNDFVPDTLASGFSVAPTLYHYVSPNGTSSYPYARPEDAAPSLADVLAAAAAGDSVLVDTTTISNAAGSVIVGATVSGGWTDNFTARDLNVARTTLDLTNNLFLGGTTDPIVFDGFRIINGNGVQDITPFNAYFGGGIHIVNANVTVSNCMFESCTAAPSTNYGAGGGIFAFNSTVVIASNTFDGNQATIGAGAYLYDCDGSVSGNTIVNNVASVGGTTDPAGGGIALENCTGVVLSSNSLDNNTGAQYGGGYWINNSTGISIDGDVASNNAASFGGAGAYFGQSTVTVNNSRFESNTSSTIGGALFADTATVTVTECEFVDNAALIGAGAYVTAGEAYFRHNVMVDNIASSTAGALYINGVTAGEVQGNTLDSNSGIAGVGGLLVVNSSIEVFNNIISNSTGHGLACSGTQPANTYNLVWASTGNDYDACAPGTGAVNADPLFKDTGTDDYRLTLNSPAIDAGRPGASYDDPDGSRGDMGRYGSHAFVMDQPSYPKDLVADFSGGDVTLTWTPNPEGDISYYAVYCDSISGFAPSADNLVTTTADSTVNLGAPVDTTYYKVSAVDIDGYASGYSIEASSEPPITTAIGDGVRYRTSLGQNQPNPFNPVTTIRFSLESRIAVELAVFDVAGRRVRTLLSGPGQAGPNEASWDGRNDRGAPVASGVYFYRLEAGAFSQTRKMLLLK